MRINYLFKLYKCLFFNINKLNDLHFDKFTQKNLRLTFLHIYKSDFLIKFFFSFVLIIVWLISLKCKFLNIPKTIIPFLYFRLEEIVFSTLFIQNKNFSENLNITNHFYKKKSYENIVVGSGPSGAITGYYLSKNKKECLILEKGKQVNLFKNKHPGKEFLYKWLNSGLNSTIYPNMISFSAGSCLGGGSEINSGLFHYPTKEFINTWIKEYEVESLNYKNLIKNFDEILHLCPVSKIDSHQGSKNFFLSGIKKNKLSFEHVPSFYHGGDLNNKNSMTKTFLKFFQENNGDICTNINVKKIKKKNDNTWEVFAIDNKKKNIVFNARNIFLNCGSIQTNKILINSKIKGDYSSFSLHPMTKAIVEFDENVQSGHENVHSYQLDHFFPDFIIGEASSGEQFIQTYCYNSKEYQNHILKNWKKMSIYHSTFSFGEGKIYKIPFINKFLFFYNIKKNELDNLKNASKKLCRVLFDGNAKYIYFSIDNKLHKFTADNYIEKIKLFTKISSFKFSSVHILGGVKLGEAQICPFDSFGEHKLLKNLYVFDSSTINHKLLKNPQGAVMSLALRNIKNFLNKNL